MLLGLIADVHSNAVALEAVLGCLNGKVDKIICAGDITGYYSRPNEVFHMLESVETTWIAGNHEAYLSLPSLESLSPLVRNSVEYMLGVIERPVLDQLVAAPTETKLEFENLRIAIYHGSPWNSEGEYVYPDFLEWQKFGCEEADVVVLGHTHIPFIRKVGNTLVMNPGSCGQPRDGDPRAAYAVFDTATCQAELKRVEYDVEKVCQEIQDLNFDPILQKVLRTGSTRG